MRVEDTVDLVGIGFRNSRDELEQFLVPILLPEQKHRVGVLDVTPDLAELGEVFDLRFAVPGRLLRCRGAGGEQQTETHQQR